MSALTSRQRAHLRALAHPLKPILQVGAEGVSDPFLRSLEEAFHTRELLKIRVLESAPLDARAVGDHLQATLDGVQVPQTIGRTVVLYRPFRENPVIRFPGE